MVKICSTSSYPSNNEEKYKQYFEKYAFPLHIFQKYAIEAIVEGHHVLVTAPTGSGKTMPGEFALDYFVKKGKKVIYTTPVKALSNQKFYDFTNKYPDISFGVLTGDIKCNPDADVLIMTTEILLNKLYQVNSNSKISSSSISFEMDIENELACVVFDEIHYIGDQNRGTVWEQSILMLPKHVQMIGLSATLDNPEKFALWCENKGYNINKKNEKIVYLAKKMIRAVPLTHYSFITTNAAIFKLIKDKSEQEYIKSMINKPFIIQNAKGEFNEEHYHKMSKMLKLFENKQVYVKRQHVLNQVSKHLFENDMLPALCFVFSKKNLEICAKELTTNLLEDDSKVPYIIDRECEQIIRKLPNYQEYLQLPEYIHMVSLLRKGVGIHHSSVTGILREMVEILFAKGYIKILFATETMSIGINMPVKTTIFTDVNKFDGDNVRILQSHEYTQAAGRAGRLGLDKVGHVIHLNNLFRNVDSINYRNMMKGTPQSLVSKFKISFNLILNLIDIGDKEFIEFAKRSMIQGDIDNELGEVYKKLQLIESECEKMEEHVLVNLRTPLNIIQEYIELINSKNTLVNKKKKECERKIEEIKIKYIFIEKESQVIDRYNNKKDECNHVKDKCNRLEQYLQNSVLNVIDFLIKDGFVEKVENNFKLTFSGSIATHLRELHCLIFAKLIEDKKIESMSVKQLVSIFSCFTNINVCDEYKSIVPRSNDLQVQTVIQQVKNMYNEYSENEIKNNINTGIEYDIHFDLINYVDKWCECETVEDCKFLIQTIEKEKEILLGEFVKALLKINNISNEIEKIAENLGAISFLKTLKEIPLKTLKYVVTNQSLYI